MLRSILDELKKSPIATTAAIISIFSFIFALFFRIPDLPVHESVNLSQNTRLDRGRILLEIFLIIPSISIPSAFLSLWLFFLFRAWSFFGAIVVFYFSVMIVCVLSVYRIAPLVGAMEQSDAVRFITVASVLISTVVNLIFSVIVGGKVTIHLENEYGKPTSGFVAGFTLFMGTNYRYYRGWWLSIIFWIPVCGIGGIILADSTIKYLLGKSPTLIEQFISNI